MSHIRPGLDTSSPARISSPRSLPSYSARALAIWPGLDRDRLRRTNGDPMRIARLVTRRTALSTDAIVAVLTKDEDREP